MFQRPVKFALANRRFGATRATGVVPVFGVPEFGVAVFGVAVLAAGVGLTLSAGGGPVSSAGQSLPTMPARQSLPTMPARQEASRQAGGTGGTVLATILESAPRYASPGRRVAGTVPATWYGRPSVLPVTATRPGIHGPLGEDREIGTTGARISHGCIRLHDQALELLDAVPPGTPIDIVS